MKMKKLFSILSIILIIAMLACVLIACDDGDDKGNNGDNNGGTQVEHIDYVSQLKLDLNSETAKFKNVTVYNYVDGDTTHFNVTDKTNFPSGVLKARYLAINTPESTGKIEAYGHKASRFTKEKLQNAVSIIIESDGSSWEADSTGSRYLTWVWYKPSEGADYRNLNVEILQEGLAVGSNTANNRYGEIAFAALNQAKAEKLNCHSGVADPELYVGDAIPVSLQELRCNITEYNNKKVAVEGIVARNDGNGVYLESEEAFETGLHSGIYCYSGYNLNGYGLEILSVGNRVKVVGTVEYYETGGTYQIADMSYKPMKPNDPNNLQRLDDETYEPAYQAIDADKFVNGTVYYEYEDEDGAHTMPVSYAEYIMDTTVSLENLKVTKVYTTTNETSSSKGAMTLTCSVGSQTITVRTNVLYDANGNLITADAYKGKTISVKGVVAYYNGYQVKVLTAKDITVLD